MRGKPSPYASAAAGHGAPFPPKCIVPDPPPPPPAPKPVPLTQAERTDRAAGVTEAALDNLRRGRVVLHQRRHASPAELERIAKMPVELLRTKVNNRHFEVALHHLAGCDDVEIGKMLGYRETKSVKRILGKPLVAALISRVREIQLEKVIAGEFGVRAQAKAAAPKVMGQLIQKAGAGALDKDGNPVGVARKDADAINAGKVVLNVSGELTERREIDVHVVLEKMTSVELRDFSEHGRWPERLKTMGQALGLPPPGED